MQEVNNRLKLPTGSTWAYRNFSKRQADKVRIACRQKGAHVSTHRIEKFRIVHNWSRRLDRKDAQRHQDRCS